MKVWQKAAIVSLSVAAGTLLSVAYAFVADYVFNARYYQEHPDALSAPNDTWIGLSSWVLWPLSSGLIMRQWLSTGERKAARKSENESS